MTQEDQATEDIAADLQVDLPADHLQEAHHTIDAQEDTKSPTPHHIDTLTIAGPNAASTNNTEDNSTQLKKYKSRCPTPLPAKLFSFPTYSDTEDPDTTCNELTISDTPDTASQISIAVHSQDEDNFSTKHNAISPPRNYHIPMTPPTTHNATLPRPSCIPIPKTLNITKNQQDKDNTSGDESTTDMEHTATMPPTRTPNTTSKTFKSHKCQPNKCKPMETTNSKFIQTQH